MRHLQSKLIRAQHTLKIILNEMGKTDTPVIIDEALNERSYGDLEGLNKAETAKKFALNRYISGGVHST